MAANDRLTDPAVEKYGWGTTATVENWLFAEGYRFDFFQAVRLLEMIQSGKLRLPPGESADPEKEIVRFRSAVTLKFPASDVAEVRRPTKQSAAPAAGP